MNNNIVTYSDLKCPSVHLKCILENLFCGMVNNPKCLDFQMALSPSPQKILTITVGGTIHQVNLTPYLDDVQLQSFTLNDLTGLVTIRETDGSTWNINLTNAIHNLETNTSVINAIVGHKIADYVNEDGTLFPINETVSTISVVGNDATFVNESGNSVTFKAYSNTAILTDAFNTETLTIVIP
jgi:hypothetical protein